MSFGQLNLIHTLSQSELDGCERGGRETSQNTSAKGEAVRLNHSHSETLPISRGCSSSVSTLYIAVPCKYAQGSST